MQKNRLEPINPQGSAYGNAYLFDSCLHVSQFDVAWLCFAPETKSRKIAEGRAPSFAQYPEAQF